LKNSISRFSHKVENYVKYRPSYPWAVISLLRSECHLTDTAVIADVGSGTGLLAELFLKNGNRVFGVEPNPEMRAAAERLLRMYPRFVSVAATAEATTLHEHSVNFVTAGQAFHWFDREQVRREFARILTPAGWVVLVWNITRTTGTPFSVAFEKFWQTYLTCEVLGAERKLENIIMPFFSPGQFMEKTLDNYQICDFKGLRGRVLSAFSAPEIGNSHYSAMLEELEAILYKHQVNGKVTIEYDTRVVYGQLS